MLDSIEKEVSEGGYIIDFHTCDMFPESWIDLVVVLQTDHTILWNRLETRYVFLLKRLWQKILSTENTGE